MKGQINASDLDKILQPANPRTTVGVVALNGPPGVGKDTIGQRLVDRINALQGSGIATTIQVKDAIYGGAATHFNVPISTFVDLCSSRETKDLPSDLLEGRTPREAVIEFAEKDQKQV